VVAVILQLLLIISVTGTVTSILDMNGPWPNPASRNWMFSWLTVAIISFMGLVRILKAPNRKSDDLNDEMPGPGLLCPKCGRPISLWGRESLSDLCPKCRLELKQEEAQAMFSQLRQFEDRVIWMMLSILPLRWHKSLEAALTNTRFRGLMKFIGGLIVGVAMFLLLLGLGKLTGHYQASALAAFPLAISMVGLMEIVLGIDFDYIAWQFDHGGFFLKLGIAASIIAFAGIYIICCYYVYRQFFR
jgi:hypothetical protein